MKICVTGRDKEEVIRYLKEKNDSFSFVEKDFDIYIGYSSLDYDLSRCKMVFSLGAGVDRFLNCRNPNLFRTIGQFGETISGYVLSYILPQKYQLDTYEVYQKAHLWKQMPYRKLKACVFGTGEIGGCIISNLKRFGIECFYVNSKTKDIYEHINEVDYIINTMPLTERTKDFFNHNLFNQMDDVVFINVGRGKEVVFEDLKEAIKSKRVKKAILDVLVDEPLNPNDWLWDNSIITPHISGLTDVKKAVDCFMETYIHWQKGEKTVNQVDLIKGY